MDEAYLKILEMIQGGFISAEEGEKLLDALAERPEPGGGVEEKNLAPGEATVEKATSMSVRPPAWADRAWIYPLAAGIALTGLAGMVTAPLVQGGSRLGWLACTLPLMIGGALVVALAWWSRGARWLHVRVNEGGRHFHFSLPLPLGLAAWLIRAACPWVPRAAQGVLDELFLALAEMEQELVVDVRQEGSEQVQVFVA